MTTPVGRVAVCARYPVKSLLGEDVPAIELDRSGVRGDRVWALRTSAGRIGAGKRTPRYVRLPHLLEMRARTASVRGREMDVSGVLPRSNPAQVHLVAGVPRRRADQRAATTGSSRVPRMPCGKCRTATVWSTSRRR